MLATTRNINSGLPLARQPAAPGRCAWVVPLRQLEVCAHYQHSHVNHQNCRRERVTRVHCRDGEIGKDQIDGTSEQICEEKGCEGSLGDPVEYGWRACLRPHDAAEQADAQHQHELSTHPKSIRHVTELARCGLREEMLRERCSDPQEEVDTEELREGVPPVVRALPLW